MEIVGMRAQHRFVKRHPIKHRTSKDMAKVHHFWIGLHRRRGPWNHRRLQGWTKKNGNPGKDCIHEWTQKDIGRVYHVFDSKPLPTSFNKIAFKMRPRACCALQVLYTCICMHVYCDMSCCNMRPTPNGITSILEWNDITSFNYVIIYVMRIGDFL